MNAMRIEGVTPAAIAAVSQEVKSSNQKAVEQPKAQEKPAEQAQPVKKTAKFQSKLDADTGIRFSVNLSEDKLQVQIIDKEKNEVIRSIPSEEMLKVMDRIDEFIGAYLDMNG